MSTDFKGKDLRNCGTGTTEGNFGQALGLYSWVPGKGYRLRVKRTERDEDGEFWTGIIKYMETGATTKIGTIHLKDVNGYSGYGDMKTRTAVFLEYYYGHSGYCDENNVFSKVQWRGPYIDGKLADRDYTWYPITCMYFRQYSPEKGTIIHEAGGKTAWNNELMDFWN